MTVDVEQDFGSAGTPQHWSACAPFLDWFGAMCAAQDWRTTLFVQGSICEAIGTELRELAERHAIGLHGHLHEQWGDPLWFAPEPRLSLAERTQRMEFALAAFARAGLARPTMFRAPNLCCDVASLALLRESGFALDSSAPAFRGALPLVTRERGLIRIPVSASPRPRMRRRYGIPTWARFAILNVSNVIDFTETDLALAVEEILACQEAAGDAQGHLVILSHPWEFVDLPRPGCAVGHRDRFEARLAWLARNFNGEFRTMLELAA